MMVCSSSSETIRCSGNFFSINEDIVPFVDFCIYPKTRFEGIGDKLRVGVLIMGLHGIYKGVTQIPAVVIDRSSSASSPSQLNPFSRHVSYIAFLPRVLVSPHYNARVARVQNERPRLRLPEKSLLNCEILVDAPQLKSEKPRHFVTSSRALLSASCPYIKTFPYRSSDIESRHSQPVKAEDKKTSTFLNLSFPCQPKTLRLPSTLVHQDYFPP
mmetsp:Transcript_11011/g.45847  ORF Transcript_11011/g.45847 Transcript_11011/m.45847 type:complete len:214 (-) Transcript_11011:3540-4181(-)